MLSRKKKTEKFLRQCLCLALLAVPLLACTARPSANVTGGRIVNFTNCQMPSDQGSGSLQGKWSTVPIPLVFDREFYATDGGKFMVSLRNAVTTWNTWSNLKGFNLFVIQNDGSDVTAGRDIPALTDCSQASYSAAVTDAIGIWKIHSYGDGKNTRPSCGTSERLLVTGTQGQTDWIIQNGRIIGGSILLNFEEFNAPGKQVLDVESLLLHELGHIAGLLHSCNGSTADAIDSTSSPSCFTPAPRQYIEAVMFPFLQDQQIRRTLGQNDYNRINCLY